MGVTNVDHGLEDGIPGFGLLEDFIGEHASVPANVLDAAVLGALEPVAGALGDIEFAVGIVSGAVLAGLVVAAGTVHFAVVLGDVEVDGPGAEGVGDLFVGGPELLLAVILLQEAVVGRYRCARGQPGSRGIPACRLLP